jgi:formylglycine-generating enzyme required for sulfatase activity
MCITDKFLRVSLLLCLCVLQAVTATQATEYIEQNTGMTFTLIEGGTYVMGDISGEDTYSLPAHKVTLQDFFLGKHEVTFAQYDFFCEQTNRSKPDDNNWGRGNLPVINVSWYDAKAFAEWLSNLTGKEFRLPAESEWEYAARGGTKSPYWWGDKENLNLANCRNCNSSKKASSTITVGSYVPNPYGLFDMTGNVYEWIMDTKHFDYSGAPQNGSPWQTGGDKTRRVTRGGSWKHTIFETKSFARCWEDPEEHDIYTGFRLVLTQ